MKIPCSDRLRGRSAGFDLIHNHLDWLPPAFSGLARADGDHHPWVFFTADPASLPALGRHLRIDLRRRPRARARVPGDSPSQRRGHDRAFSATAGEALVCFGCIHPDKGTARSIEIARRADRPLVRCGPVHDERYFIDEIEPHVEDDSDRYLGSAGGLERAQVLGGARVCCRRLRSQSRSVCRSSSRCCAGRPSSPTLAGQCRR